MIAQKRSLGALWIITLAGGCALAGGCGDAAYTKYYDPEVDSDIGGAGPSPADSDSAAQPSGDPCSSASPFQCDPLAAASCAGETSGCDYGEVDGVHGFYCYTDCTEPVGAACDPADGPWCAAGATCRDGVCAAYCCGAADCSGGLTCDPVDLEHVEGALGVCVGADTETDL